MNKPIQQLIDEVKKNLSLKNYDEARAKDLLVF